jgi:hypothetical protein
MSTTEAADRNRRLSSRSIKRVWHSKKSAVRDESASALRDLPLSLHKLVPADMRRATRHRFGRYYAWEVDFDFHATPPLERRESYGPPEFVGIGVQKAGTTWWWRLIVKHPQVSQFSSKERNRHFSGPISKERHFFGRFGLEPFKPSDVKEYHEWFPRKEGTITGEWTPDYLYHPWVPPLVARAAPDAKLLLMLRDPIQRFRSGYAAALREGSANHVGASVAEAMGHSLYADNVSRWLDHFPSEQLLILQYEKCVVEPTEHLAETYRFLGIDPDYQPPRILRPVNSTVEAKKLLDDDVERRLRDIFGPDVEKLAKLVPGLDPSLWSLGVD